MQKLDFIAEVGSNWKASTYNESYKLAMSAIIQAANAGATIVKFQIFKADTLYSKMRAPKLWKRFQDYELPLEWLPDLQTQAHDAGVQIWYSVFDPNLIGQVAQYTDGLKLASGDLLYRPLYMEMAAVSEEYQIPMAISTGMANTEEIVLMLEDIVFSAKDEGIYLMNCVSSYPAKAEDYALNSIYDIGIEWADRIGLSDHTMDSLTAQLAVARGYTFFEKHFRPDNSYFSPDAIVSMTPNGFKQYVQDIKLANQILGIYRKEPVASETNDRLWARRGSDGLRPTDGVYE